MNKDDPTAYICIYCPFNSDNLESLENHLTSAHGHGCQDVSLTLPTSSTIITKTGKREAPDDEQSQSSTDGIKSTSGQGSSVKRIKRASPTTIFPLVYTNGHNNESEHSNASDAAEDDDDERDSSINPTTSATNLFLTCPLCGVTSHRLDQLFEHAKRKHHIDLSNYEGNNTLNMLSAERSPTESADIETPQSPGESKEQQQQRSINIIGLDTLEKSNGVSGEAISSSVGETNLPVTDCPYCDFKTTDKEQFKLHIVAHIRDKNYRCLLCNRLYKYRGDCSFHIRRKHHRYSANSNDYIQRFLFDVTDGQESMATQTGAHGSTLNGSLSGSNAMREQDEPIRYFGCPYCDYTSNYGGDVRKHQARKHPNLESKVMKIMRQDAEHHLASSSTLPHEEEDNEAKNPVKPNKNLLEPSGRKEKIKTVKKTEAAIIQQYPTKLSIPPNFAPVRVFQCSACHQQGTYKWVVERHIRAKHADQADAHVIELPAELAVKLQKITPPLKRFRCSLCQLQSKHTWVIIRHIKHFHTLQTASVLDIQPDGTPTNDGSFSFPNGDLSQKSSNHDSESSSHSSSFGETRIDENHESFLREQIDDELDGDENESINSSMIVLYKCSLCNFTSNIPWTTQKHLNDIHPGQTNAHLITQCRPNITETNHKSEQKTSKTKNGTNLTGVTIRKLPFGAPLSPTTAMAKAKFSPAVEEALLALQCSKLRSAGLYVAQPKFGIKRLKCRHCFYRSNWKTDMIRHVRIRHNLTEPDHNKDMITMTEDEARSTIETYENTFGKELRRRTFRTWNDWAKAEEEFTPKDGSLQYSNTNVNLPVSHKLKSSTSVLGSSTASTSDDVESSKLIKINHETKVATTTSSWLKEDFHQLPNPSNIVSRLLLTTSPLNNADDDVPLDLSLKSSSQTKSSEIEQSDFHRIEDDQTATIRYRCSACPYAHSDLPSVEEHLSFHFTGQGVACPLCFFTSSSESSMIRHMMNNHSTSHNLTRFSSITRISTAHIIEEYQCPLCSYQCERADDFEIHRRREHRQDADEDEEEFDVENSSNSAPVDNEEIEVDADHQQLSPNASSEHPFQCPLCSTSSSSMNSCENLQQFTVHIFTHHERFLKNNQSCPFCSFIAHTTSIYSLAEHIKLHFNGSLVQPDPIIGIEHVKELLME